MNKQEILELIVPFKGTYKGKPLGYILQENRGWVEFMAEKAYNPKWRQTFQRALTIELPKASKELVTPTYSPVNSPYPLSVYQQAIIDSYTTGKSLAVEARAGSGKTFILKLLAEMTNQATVRVVAFNVHIAKELGQKLAHKPMNVTVQTLHSAARRILDERLPHLKVDGDDTKYRDIIREMIQHEDGTYDRELARVVRELTKMARLTLTDYRDYEAMEETANTYNTTTEIVVYTDDGKEVVRVSREEILSLTKKALDKGLKQADTGLLDFDDMLFLVASRGYMPKVQADVVMADEAQDFNLAGIKTLLSLGKQGSQKVIVGDPYQSIQGFAYASYDSFNQLREALGEHKRLTMPITYRCPLEHVKLAQEIVPDLQARENAPLGILEYAHSEDLYTLVKVGDLVICRTTAPLIKACIKLLQRGTPAFVRGRALHKELTALIKKAMDFAKVRDFSQALTALFSYKLHHLALLDKSDAGETTIENFTDRVECCEALLKAYPVKSLEELSVKIQALTVSPDEGEKVTLASGHRSKGDENQRVFVLNYSWLPMVRGDMSSDQAKQEEYLHYVILTRSQEELYLLDDKHESILDRCPPPTPEKTYRESELPFSDIEELIKMVQKKKYKGRHRDITNLAVKIGETFGL